MVTLTVKPVAVETGVLKVGTSAGDAEKLGEARVIGTNTVDRTRIPRSDAIRLDIWEDGRDFMIMRPPSTQFTFWTNVTEICSRSTFAQRIPGF